MYNLAAHVLLAPQDRMIRNIFQDFNINFLISYFLMSYWKAKVTHCLLISMSQLNH